MNEAPKAGASRAFRPRAKTAERLDYAADLGLNVSELINEILDQHLRTHLEQMLKVKQTEIEERREKLRQALSAPMP